MKKIILVFLLTHTISANAQTIPPPYNGHPDIRMDTGKKIKEYVRPTYWTIWFTLNKVSKDFVAYYDSIKCYACDSMEYLPHSKWIQSFNDSSEAYGYYHHLKAEGKVLIWHKYECGVDTTSVYIDRYDMVKGKYNHEQ